METLSMAFGMLMMLVLILVVVVVMGIVKVNRLNENLNLLRSVMNDDRNDNEHRFRSTEEVISNDRKEFGQRFDEVYRVMDSRFDKMEYKFISGNSAKKQING